MRNLLTWVKDVARRMGTEDVEGWGERIPTSTEGQGEEVWKLKMTWKFDTLMNWILISPILLSEFMVVN